MKDTCFVTYTHSNCKDVWVPYFDSLKNFCPGIHNYILVDKFPSTYFIHYGALFFKEYDDSANYCSEFVRILNDIPFEYFIYMQEDFILYDHVKKEEIERLREYLEKTGFSYARLIKCGDLSDVKLEENIFLAKSGQQHNSINSYSMQPTLWRKEDFIKLYTGANQSKFGENMSYTHAMNQLGLEGVYYFNGEKKRGSNHHDSSIFPYTATAIVRGKWNTGEYSSELEKIFKLHSIDKNLRGTI